MDQDHNDKDASEELERKTSGMEPMTVPSGYFTTFSSRLQDRINAEKSNEMPGFLQNFFPTRRRLVPAFALLSVLILAVSLSVRWFESQQRLVIPQAQVSELIEFSGYNFDEGQLIEVLEKSDDSLQTITEGSQIIDYLSTQDLDLTDVTIDL